MWWSALPAASLTAAVWFRRAWHLPQRRCLHRYREIVRALEPGVDLYICETMSSAMEARVAATVRNRIIIHNPPHCELLRSEWEVGWAAAGLIIAACRFGQAVVRVSGVSKRNCNALQTCVQHAREVIRKRPRLLQACLEVGGGKPVWISWSLMDDGSGRLRSVRFAYSCC